MIDLLILSTGWSEPVPGRELHPLKSSAFHGALLRQLRKRASGETCEDLRCCQTSLEDNYVVIEGVLLSAGIGHGKSDLAAIKQAVNGKLASVFLTRSKYYGNAVAVCAPSSRNNFR